MVSEEECVHSRTLNVRLYIIMCGIYTHRESQKKTDHDIHHTIYIHVAIPRA